MTPKGGVIFPSGMGREDIMGFSDEDYDIDEYKGKEWGKINVGGASILMRCDGSHRVEEIIREFYTDNYEESVEPILSYLHMALSNFDIDVGKTPFKEKTHITGSLDYYHPLKILLEITSRSNLHCGKKTRLGHDMSAKAVISAIDKLQQCGTRDVELAGGEPLLHPDFIEIFNSCVKKFKKVVVTTNGLLLDEPMVEELAKHTNVVVQIRLDGSTPGLYERRWGARNAFQKVLHASQLLVSQGVSRRTIVAIGKDNANEVEDIFQLSCELGIGEITYDFVRPTCGNDFAMSPHDTLEWKHKIDELTSGSFYGTLSFLSERERKVYSDTCGAGTMMLAVGPQGNVKPCPYLPEEYVVGGNLFESKDFSTVFKSSMNERFLTLEFPGGDLCKECEFIDHCSGCFCNGVLMYENIGEKCTWGTHSKLDEWISFPP